MEGEVSERNRLQPPSCRLTMPRGYRVAADADTLLPWSHVVEQLERARNYWLATTRPDGRPHVTPVWAAWVDGALYFDGIYTARWARNLAANPAASVHLESGADVVILEGTVEDVVPEAELAARIVEAFAAKYVSPLPQAARGMYRLRPRSVRAWSHFPDDATRWDLGEE
jgi:nitroimidazol reductase NimA-like FMN-containing flavoprotein (pyridoxamine 5'-phosphate oxidase superfamily)